MQRQENGWLDAWIRYEGSVLESLQSKRFVGFIHLSCIIFSSLEAACNERSLTTKADLGG